LAACAAHNDATFVYQLAAGANIAALSCVAVIPAMLPGARIYNTELFAPFWVSGCTSYTKNQCGDSTAVGNCDAKYVSGSPTTCVAACPGGKNYMFSDNGDMVCSSTTCQV
jgi:hypothetical protein